MKKALFFLFVMVAALAAQGQGFEWVRTYTGPDISGTTTNKIVGSCVDSLGNLYILGEFSPQAQLCGVELLPHEIITTPFHNAVVIAKLSPDGDLVWHKAIYCTGFSAAHGLCQLGDTAFMVKTSLELPYDMGYGQYNNLYYLDTLLTGNDDYLMSTDSIGEYVVNAFISFRNNGDVLEQHFICVGWQDTSGNTLTPNFLGQGTMEKMFCRILSNEPFGVDNDGNIYVVRQTYDQKYNLNNGQEWSVVDGTIGALKIMVDGVRPLYYYPTQRSALWNQQILKFSPHFDSLITAVYVFDSTYIHDPNTTIKVHDFNVDFIGNIYINLMCQNVMLPLRVSNADSMFVDLSTWMPSIMMKYNVNLQAVGMVRLYYEGDSSIYVQPNIIYSHIDDKTNSIFLSGNVNWPINIAVDGITYGSDTLNLLRCDAYWIRLDKDDLHLLSYGKVHAVDGGFVYEPKVVTQNGRVLAQTTYATRMNFNGTTISTLPGTDDNVFLGWSLDGQELFSAEYHSYAIGMLYTEPKVIDSVVYLLGTLYADATFDTITTQSWGHSYAYIAKYVDPEFMVPYLPESERLVQSIEWNQGLQLSLADSVVALTATSTSGLPVKYACSDTNIARVVGSTLHLLSEGDASITASQPGNSQYRPADPVTKLLHVSSTGIAQGEKPGLAVYPNPARDVLSLDLGNEMLLQATAVSVLGQATPVAVGIDWVDISPLPAGTYLLEVETARHNKYKTIFVKQ